MRKQFPERASARQAGTAEPQKAWAFQRSERVFGSERVFVPTLLCSGGSGLRFRGCGSGLCAGSGLRGFGNNGGSSCILCSFGSLLRSCGGNGIRHLTELTVSTENRLVSGDNAAVHNNLNKFCFSIFSNRFNALSLCNFAQAFQAFSSSCSLVIVLPHTKFSLFISMV